MKHNRIAKDFSVLIILCFLTALIPFFTGCSSEEVVTDHADNEIRSLPDRVISMSPNLTQIIFELGAEGKLVGVDEYSHYPPEAQDLPTVGNYLDPDLEALVTLEPDIVLTVNTDERMAGHLDRLGISFVSFGNDTIDDILGSVLELGRILDREEQADSIVSRFESALREIESELEGVPPTRVALVVGRNPGALQDIIVVNSQSFLGEIIEIAGGENVFGELGMPYPQVGAESIVGADPDLIIDSTFAKGATEAQLVDLLSDWDSLPSLRAVQNDRVIAPSEGWFQVPGAFIDSTLRLFAHWLHPDIFPDNVEDPSK